MENKGVTPGSTAHKNALHRAFIPEGYSRRLLHLTQPPTIIASFLLPRIFANLETKTPKERAYLAQGQSAHPPTPSPDEASGRLFSAPSHLSTRMTGIPSLSPEHGCTERLSQGGDHPAVNG